MKDCRKVAGLLTFCGALAFASNPSLSPIFHTYPNKIGDWVLSTNVNKTTKRLLFIELLASSQNNSAEFIIQCDGTYREYGVLIRLTLDSKFSRKPPLIKYRKFTLSVGKTEEKSYVWEDTGRSLTRSEAIAYRYKKNPRDRDKLAIEEGEKITDLLSKFGNIEGVLRITENGRVHEFSGKGRREAMTEFKKMCSENF